MSGILYYAAFPAIATLMSAATKVAKRCTSCGLNSPHANCVERYDAVLLNCVFPSDPDANGFGAAWNWKKSATFSRLH